MLTLTAKLPRLLEEDFGVFDGHRLAYGLTRYSLAFLENPFSSHFCLQDRTKSDKPSPEHIQFVCVEILLPRKKPKGKKINTEKRELAYYTLTLPDTLTSRRASLVGFSQFHNHQLALVTPSLAQLIVILISPSIFLDWPPFISHG